eukprot:15343851-Ditylum_brightwellii.AAC.1
MSDTDAEESSKKCKNLNAYILNSNLFAPMTEEVIELDKLHEVEIYHNQDGSVYAMETAFVGSGATSATGGDVTNK